MVQIVVETKQTIIHASCLAKQPPIHLWRRILANNNGQWPVKRCRQSRYCRFFSIPLVSTWRGGKGWNLQVGSRQQIPSRPRKPRWAQLGRCSNYRSTGLTDSTCGLVGRDSQGRQTAVAGRQVCSSKTTFCAAFSPPSSSQPARARPWRDCLGCNIVIRWKKKMDGAALLQRGNSFWQQNTRSWFRGVKRDNGGKVVLNPKRYLGIWLFSICVKQDLFLVL